MPNSKDRIVWSSDQGDVRKKETGIQNAKSLPPHEQTVYLHRDSKGRAGGVVTLVKKLVLTEGDLRELTTKLKKACGSGGTIRDGMIEIQGEQREKIAETLKKLGYKVKIAGG